MKFNLEFSCHTTNELPNFKHGARLSNSTCNHSSASLLVTAACLRLSLNGKKEVLQLSNWMSYLP